MNDGHSELEEELQWNVHNTPQYNTLTGIYLIILHTE